MYKLNVPSALKNLFYVLRAQICVDVCLYILFKHRYSHSFLSLRFFPFLVLRLLSDSLETFWKQQQQRSTATSHHPTNRYYEKDSQINDQHQQQIKSHHNKYEFDLERDHALPTSAPNADILKSNNNPTYPNPNRHHNHNHRHQNATPSPQGNHYVSILMIY